jgi:pimeloyl-ACP methyl ester carboxylesterase
MEHFFDYPNGRLYYRDTGPSGKPALILVHGFGEDGDIWTAQVDTLKDHARIIIPDLPGSGRSGYAPGISNSIDKMANLLWLLVHQLCHEPVVLLGHSMGGYIVLAMMEQWGSAAGHASSIPVAGFGLVHSTAFADTDEKKATRQKAIEFIGQHGGYPFLQSAIPGLFGQAFQQQHPGIVQALVQKSKAFEDEALVAYYEAMIARPDRTAVLRQSKQPVLFLAGEEDKAAPLNDLLQQMHLPKKSMIKIWQEVGHMGMLEATKHMNDAMLKFMQLVG